MHCSHDIMLRTKQTHTYTYYRFIQNHFDLHTPSRQPHHRFQFLNSKYTSPFFLNFTYCIKDTNLHGILRNYYPVTQSIYSVPSQRPSMPKNPDPSLSRMSLSSLLKYPYWNSFTILNIIIRYITSSKTHLTSLQ